MSEDDPREEVTPEEEEEEEGYATQATRGMLWTSLSSLLARGLGFAVTMVLTYWIARDDYGQANAAFTLAMTLGFFAVPGFPSELVRRRERFAEAATLAILFCCLSWALLAGACLLLSEPLASMFDTNSRYLRLSLAIPTVIVPLLMGEIILNRDLRFGAQSLLEMGGSLSNAGVAIGLAAAGFGGLAVILGQVVRESIIRLVGTLLVGLRWLRRPRLDLKLLWEMLSFGVPVYISNLLEFAAQNWDNLFVARTFGAKALGPYAVAYTLAYTPIYTVTQRVSSVILATVARFSEDEERRREAILRALGAIMMLLGVAAVLTMVCGPRVVRLLIAKDWSEIVAQLVVALALVGVGLPLQFLPDYYFQAIGRPRATVVVMAIKVALMFSALYVFGRASVEAAAWSVSGSFVVAGLLACGLLAVVDKIPLHQVFISLVPATVGCALMAGSIWGMRQILPFSSDLLMLLIEVAGSCVVYLAYQVLFHRERVKDILGSLLGR